MRSLRHPLALVSASIIVAFGLTGCTGQHAQACDDVNARIVAHVESMKSSYGEVKGGMERLLSVQTQNAKALYDIGQSTDDVVVSVAVLALAQSVADVVPIINGWVEDPDSVSKTGDDYEAAAKRIESATADLKNVCPQYDPSMK